MTRSFRRFNHSLAAIAIAVALTLAWVPGAAADPLDDAKATGTVGEQLNGFLGLVKPDAPASVVELVKSVNNKRKDHYAAIAQKNGTNISAVAKLAGEKAIELTAPGNYVQTASGAWQKK